MSNFLENMQLIKSNLRLHKKNLDCQESIKETEFIKNFCTNISGPDDFNVEF